MTPEVRGLTVVTFADTKADEDGLVIQITVQRSLPGMFVRRGPIAADIPSDVRAALRAWLDAADRIPLEQTRS